MSKVSARPLTGYGALFSASSRELAFHLCGLAFQCREDEAVHRRTGQHVAASGQHEGALGVGDSGRLDGQAGLSDAGLAGEQHDLSSTDELIATAPAGEVTDELRAEDLLSFGCSFEPFRAWS
jgi:hypothetical protein